MTYRIKVRAHGKVEYHYIWAPDKPRALIKFGKTPNETVVEVTGIGN